MKIAKRLDRAEALARKNGGALPVTVIEVWGYRGDDPEPMLCEIIDLKAKTEIKFSTREEGETWLSSQTNSTSH